MRYSASTIANAFLKLAKRDGKKLDNMQLQKLVYIAHGYNLARLGKPLFFNNVHAFEWGPVIPALYKALRKYGAGEVRGPIETKDTIPPFGGAEMQIVEEVWKAYGGLSGPSLSSITHKAGTPWSQTWEGNKFGVIPNDLIAAHYSTLLNERSGK
jgi:uncharacterized phage-associated protein